MMPGFVLISRDQAEPRGITFTLYYMPTKRIAPHYYYCYKTKLIDIQDFEMEKWAHKILKHFIKLNINITMHSAAQSNGVTLPFSANLTIASCLCPNLWSHKANIGSRDCINPLN